MKKFFSFCLMSMAAVTMSAAEVPFTVTPASGSVVEQISSVIFELDPDSGYVELEVTSKDDIHFYFNGEEFCGINRPMYGDASMELTPQIPILQPGEYELVIPAYSICWYDDAFMPFDNEEDLVFNYTIDDGGGIIGGDLPFNVTPAAGSVVEQISSVILALDTDSGYVEFDVNTKDDIYFNFNGEFFCGTKSTPFDDALEIIPQIPILQPGEYELVIEPYAICWANEDWSDVVDNFDQLVFTYTIDGGGTVIGGDLPFNVYPAPDSEVESLEVITLTLNFEDSPYVWMSIDFPEEMYFMSNGERLPIAINAETLDEVSWDIIPEAPITEAGTYELHIPAGCMLYMDDAEEFYDNPEEIVLSYIVLGVPEPAEPVVYDVVPTGYNPKDGSEIDFSERDFDGVTISVEEGILPAEDAMVTVVPVGYEDEAIEAPLAKVKYMNQLRAEWTAMEYNGEYLVIIPKGSFGDENWLNDPETGHANDAITLTYTIINAKDRASLVEYTLEPEVTYTDELTSFTLEFPEGVQMISNAYATLDNTEARYYEYAVFTDNGDNTFTVEFNEAPVEPGNYTFLVAEGLFGDQEFIESDGHKGVANAAVEMVIEFTSSGVKAVINNAYVEGVYNLNGVKVADSTDHLPAGIYIVNGKKVTVK